MTAEAAQRLYRTRSAVLALLCAVLATACFGTTATVGAAAFAGRQGALELARCNAVHGVDTHTEACKRDAALALLHYNRKLNACYGYAWQYPYTSDAAVSHVPRQLSWMRYMQQSNLRRASHAGDVASCYEAARSALDENDRLILYARMCGMGEALGCACMRAESSKATVEVDGVVHACGGTPHRTLARASSFADVERELLSERANDHVGCEDVYCQCYTSRSVRDCTTAAMRAATAESAYRMLELGCPTNNPQLLGTCYGEKLAAYNEHFGRPLSSVVALNNCARGTAADPVACVDERRAYEQGVAKGEARVERALETLGADRQAIEARRARWEENRRRMEQESNESRARAIAGGLQQFATEVQQAVPVPQPASRQSATVDAGQPGIEVQYTEMPASQPESPDSRSWKRPDPPKIERRRFAPVDLCAGTEGCNTAPAKPSQATQQ